MMLAALCLVLSCLNLLSFYSLVTILRQWKRLYIKWNESSWLSHDANRVGVQNLLWGCGDCGWITGYSEVNLRLLTQAL